MSRVFFRAPLEAMATFWRVRRRDGVTLGLTSHDRDLWFDGIVHRAAPGMVPSAEGMSAPSASTCTYIVSAPRSLAVRLSGVSTATTRPLLMMTTRWQVCETSGRMWVLSTIV